MSGFIGLIHLDGTPVERELLSRLTDGLAFRSNAPPACLVKESVGFGYAPLLTVTTRPEALAPILDSTTGIVADARLDDRNGLIQTFDAGVRSRLSTMSDAELILYCYGRWGRECARHLLGDFSFAIWDGKRRRLFCARDHLGVKPFFYVAQPGRMMVGNTLECIRAHPAVSEALNESSIADFLLFGSNQDPSVTAFQAIQRLPAGHTLTVEPGSLKIERYWHPQWGEPIRYPRTNDYLHHFREILQQAAGDRVSSGHTAVLMSGGVDSTAVAAAAQKTATTLKAFTVVYDHLLPDQERRYSTQAARHLKIPINHFAVDQYGLYERAGDPGYSTPEPSDGALTAAFIDHLRHVSSFSSVALCGHGGDAILAITPELGPSWIRTGRGVELAAATWQYFCLRHRIPPLGFRGAARRMWTRTPAGEELDFPVWIHPDLTSRLNLRERWMSQPAKYPERPAILSDPAWPALFESYDAGVTQVPIEVRYPLFDLRVVNYCLRLKAIPWCLDKTVLRSAMRGWLPESIRLRPKTPMAGDPVAIRLARSEWVDVWDPGPQLARFVQRNRVPRLAGTGIAPFPHLRALSLDLWLRGLTKPPINGTSRSDGFEQDATQSTVHHP